MPVIDTTTDTDALSVTITAHFAAPVERVWQIYADPRQLERVWGPPTYPATFVEHDLSAGGRMTYYMTSPEGERYGGWWRVESVDEPTGFSFDDGFADADLRPDPTQPVSHAVYSFEPDDGGTRALFRSTFESAADLAKVLEMGMEEGARSAINQVDDLLAGQLA